MWQGGDCWIIGGGPSLAEQFDIPEEVIQNVKDGIAPLQAFSPYLSAIHKKHIIGINVAYMLGDWVDMMFFGDKRFFLERRRRLAEFPGLKVSCHQTLNHARYKADRIKYLVKDRNKPKGISFDSRKVSWNANSGAAAISIAAHTGVSRIILLGFDMKMNDAEEQHWHKEYMKDKSYKMPPTKLPFERHLIGFNHIMKDAKKLGIEIINACPDSAITQFRKTTVKELL